MKEKTVKAGVVLFLTAMFLSACAPQKEETLQMQVADGYIQYYNGQEWKNLIEVEELRGPQGPAGEDGINGTDGENGKDGRSGKDGMDGVPGLNGTDGKDGVDGKNGADGQDGQNGADGKDGTQAEACDHRYRQISQTVEKIQDLDDGGYLARRTYTMICDLCDRNVQMYYDFEVPPMPTPTPVPTPYSTPEPTQTPTEPPVSTSFPATPNPTLVPNTPTPDQTQLVTQELGT